MLEQHDELLLDNEALEAGVVQVIRIPRDDVRSGALPPNILRLWEQFLHQLILCRKLDVNMALTQATTSTLSVLLETVDSQNSLSQVDELDKAIKSLTGDSLHDDMDWLIRGLADEFGVTAKEGKHFGAGRTIRDLYFVRKEISGEVSKTYILNLDNTIVVRFCLTAVLRKRDIVWIKSLCEKWILLATMGQSKKLLT